MSAESNKSKPWKLFDRVFNQGNPLIVDEIMRFAGAEPTGTEITINSINIERF